MAIKLLEGFLLAVATRHFAFGCAVGFVSGMIGLIIGVLAFGFMFQDFVVQRKEETLRPPPITVGLKASYDWQVISQDGDVLDLETVQGKTIFITFWHPACVPCLAQLPSINRLYNKLEGSDVVFVIVATDNKDELPDIIAKENIDFPVYTLLSDRPDIFASPDTPANFIVDPDGNIMFKQIGGAKWDDENILEFLLDLSGGMKIPSAQADQEDDTDKDLVITDEGTGEDAVEVEIDSENLEDETGTDLTESNEIPAGETP